MFKSNFVNDFVSMESNRKTWNKEIKLNFPSSQSIFNAYITFSCKDTRSSIQNAYPPFFKNISSDIVVSGSGTLLNREWVLFSMSPLVYFTNKIGRFNDLEKSGRFNISNWGKDGILLKEDTKIVCHFSSPNFYTKSQQKESLIPSRNVDERNNTNPNEEDELEFNSSISIPVVEILHINCETQKKWISSLIGRDYFNPFNNFSNGWHLGWNTSQDDISLFGGMVLGRLQYPLDEACEEDNPFKNIWKNHDWISNRNTRAIQHGESIYSIGSPFGITSPGTFQNSITKGIVSNTIGSKHSYIFLTDLRMLPGCEGGPVIAKISQKDNTVNLGKDFNFYTSQLVGINSLPLRSVNEKVEMNMGYTYEPIRQEILKILQERSLYQNKTNVTSLPFNQILWENKLKDDLYKQNNILKEAIESVVRVQISNLWASGILLQSTTDKRYVLTNAHVFAPFIETRNKNSDSLHGKSFQLSHRIVITQHKLSSKYESHTFLGDLIGIVDQGPLDLAILSVNSKPEEGYSKGIKMNYKERLKTGESIYIIGHPIYDPNLNLKPTVTHGSLSKVVRYKGIPTLIQTNALVHGGNSGGLVASKEGKMIGIVTSNASLYDPISRTNLLIPSLNFAIPVSRMQDIQHFIEGKLSDLELDEALNKMDQAVSKVWMIQGNENTIGGGNDENGRNGGEVPIFNSENQKKGALLKLFEELQSKKPQHMMPRSKL